MSEKKEACVACWYPKPCIDNFKYLVQTDHERLMNWILSGVLEDSKLTFALEELGYVNDSSMVDFLLLYIEHPSRIVREGAVLGLSAQTTKRGYVLERLQHMKDNDSSAGVRAAANDAIHSLKKRL